MKIDIKNLIKFHATSWRSRNLHFDGLLLSKACKVSDEKVQKSYISCHWRVMQSLTKNWQLVPKMTCGISWISMQAVVSLKICTLMCYFCWKYITFEPRKYRGFTCHKTAEWCKISGGTTYTLKNDMRNLFNFDSTHGSLNMCTLIDSFWPKHIMFGLKQYRAIMRHYTEDRCKFWRKNDLCFHKWDADLMKFTRALKSPRYVMFELRNYRGVMCHETKGWWYI